MKTIRKFIKAIAAFMFLNTLCYIFYPTAALALTSGPTAPEYSSFEPFDTTDMVNLQTGDFVYNIPLLEVPGPAGGYPLSLSYHAGISPDLEASWVGLGWTLNPGAINRTVSGYPDDFNGIQQVDRMFWEKEKVKSKNIGFSYGLANTPASTSFGLTFANSNFQGKGVGTFFSFGLSFGNTNKLGLSVNGSVSPYSGATDVNIGSNVGRSIGGADADSKAIGGVGLGVNYSIGGGTANAGLYGGAKGVGANISTDKNNRFSMSVLGASKNVYNAKSGKVSTKNSGFNIEIPTVVVPGLNLRLGYSFHRNWIDESASSDTQGSLYLHENSFSNSNYKTLSYDTYDNVTLNTLVDEEFNAQYKDISASFVDNDLYMVSGQGIGGRIEPYHFQSYLNRESMEKESNDNKYLVKNYYLDKMYGTIGFRFSGDFSNHLSNPDFSFDFDPANSTVPLTITNSEREFYTGLSGSDGFSDNNKLFGSRSIKWFKRSELIDGSAFSNYGFIWGDLTDNAIGSDKIGGFMITNESGVTYHYGQAVYSYDEYSASINTNKEERQFFNQLSKEEPYAYTWLLTAVTGPDYVDRSLDGLSQDDYGYWVEFDYGLWTDKYKWRNPGVGNHTDVDSEFSFFSKGKKEIYYLNAIRTASHTAYFVKDLRYDAKSATTLIDPAVTTTSDTQIDKWDEGGFYPKLKEFSNDEEMFDFPVPSLKLSSVLLYENSKDPGLSEDSGNRFLPIEYDYGSGRVFEFPHEENVLLSNDLEDNDKDNALREIKFDHDYSLMPETPNSFRNNFYDNDYPSTDNYDLFGKLTLNSIEFNGKSGASGALPPLKFYYDLGTPVTGNSTYYATGYGHGSFQASSSGLSSGDIVRFDDIYGNTTFFRVSSTSGSTVTVVEITSADNRLVEGNYEGTWLQTKNPGYYKDATDIWDSYKVDYSEHEVEKIRNLAKRTSPESANHVDVWSLRRIKSSIGSEIAIAYESDDYKKSVLLKNNSLIMKDKVNSHSSQWLINFYGDPYLPDILKEDQVVDVTSVYVESRAGSGCGDDLSEVKSVSFQIPILEVNNNSIKIDITPFQEFSAYEWSDGGCSYDRSSCKGYFISFPDDVRNCGGGLRVNSVSVMDPISDRTKTTHYDYSKDGLTSGVTSYDPLLVESVPEDYFTSRWNLADYEGHLREFKKALYKDFSKLLSYSRDIPGPGVTYEYVTVKESSTNGENDPVILPNKTVYNFQVFEENMIQIDEPEVIANSVGVFANRQKIHNLSVNAGSLKSISHYSTDNGEDRLISRTTNKYLYDQYSGQEDIASSYMVDMEDFNKQGVITTSAATARWVEIEKDSDELDVYGVVTQKTEYPNIPLGQINENFVSGISSETYTLKYDFFSGQPLETYSKDIYGNQFVNKIIPAYQLRNNNNGYQYPDMGLKDEDRDNKNLLTQEGASFTMMLNGDFDPNVDNDWEPYKESTVSGSLQTWSKYISVIGGTNSTAQRDIYRKQASFNYIGDISGLNNDGTHQNVSVDNFYFQSGQNVPAADGWRKNGEITLYDVNSHALEAVDINGNYASTKLDIYNNRVISTAVNATYNEQFYTGAEDYIVNTYKFGGGVELGEYSTVKSGGGRTGEYYVGSTGVPFKITTSDVDLGEKYLVQVWADQDNAEIYYKTTGGLFEVVDNLKVKGEIDGWYMIEGMITSPIDHISGDELFVEVRSNTPSTKFDDFRFFPLSSGITNYVYNEWGELSVILDRNNLGTYYYYDDLGRLSSVWSESFQYGKKKLSDTEINYAQHN